MPFNIDLDKDNPEFLTLFTTVEAEVRPLIPEKLYVKRKYASHLKLILLNLLKAYKQNRQRSVGYYNKRNTFYPQKVGTQGLKISYEPFRDIVQSLQALGFITVKKGFSFESGNSRNSRMIGTAKLMTLFRSARSTFPDENRIALKAADGTYLSYKETPEISKMRANLEKFNKLLEQHFVGLYISDVQLEKLRKIMREKGKPYLDVSKKVLHRTFSRGSFDFGGRYHGGFWISLLKDYRPFIRIDHQEVVARDFTATVFSLMYLSKGLDVPKADAYLFPGADPRDREVLKAAAQMLVNNPSRQSALQAINFEVIYKSFTYRIYSAEEIVSAWEKMHEAVKDLFYRDLGVIYQRLESNITEAVMLRFVSMSKPILPIHDGFLVKQEDTLLLEQTMNEEVIAMYGKPMPFKSVGPSKLKFMAGEDERNEYSEYYLLWTEHELDQQEYLLESKGDDQQILDGYSFPLAA